MFLHILKKKESRFDVDTSERETESYHYILSVCIN